MVRLSLCSADGVAGPARRSSFKRELLLTLHSFKRFSHSVTCSALLGLGVYSPVTRFTKKASEEQLYWSLRDISCMDPHFRKKPSTPPYYK